LWVENMTTERTQDPTVPRVFLRKIFSRCICVFAKIYLGTEDLDLLFFSLDSEVLKEIDEIDVLRSDNSATSSKFDRNRVDFQDMTEPAPVLDVVLVGPIQIVEFLLYGGVESVAHILPFRVVFLPLVLLAQTTEFGKGRKRRSVLELGKLREKRLQWCGIAGWPRTAAVVLVITIGLRCLRVRVRWAFGTLSASSPLGRQRHGISRWQSRKWMS